MLNGYLRVACTLLCICFLLTAKNAAAGPFADFFQKVKSTLTQPEEKSPSHRTANRNRNEDATQKSDSSKAGSKIGNAPPDGRNTRATARVKTNNSKSELKYGTPVPGKKGLVTSPFSPDAGYIDVRSFPPGTPVKDPYSGKVFLTP